MKLYKALILILIFILLIVNLISCSKPIKKEYEEVEVTIIDASHTSTWIQVIPVGKMMTMITHPATYKITVEYNTYKYYLTDKDTYDKYKDSIGQTVNATLEIETYENGNVHYDILSLE